MKKILGASAGGLEAFTILLEHLSPDTGMAFVLTKLIKQKQSFGDCKL